MIFNFSTAHWTRAPVPQPNPAIQFYGLCRELSPTGILRLKVDSTALNFSSNASAPSDDTSGSAGSTASAQLRHRDGGSSILLPFLLLWTARTLRRSRPRTSPLPWYKSLIRMHELGLCTIPNCSSNILDTCHRPQVPFFRLYSPYRSSTACQAIRPLSRRTLLTIPWGNTPSHLLLIPVLPRRHGILSQRIFHLLLSHLH